MIDMWFDIIKAEAQYDDHVELKRQGDLYSEIREIITTQLKNNTMKENHLKRIQDRELPKVTRALESYLNVLNKEILEERPGGTMRPWLARQLGITTPTPERTESTQPTLSDRRWSQNLEA